MRTSLIIGFTWPEPATTAAGKRMMRLINFFFEYGYEIHFASSAKKTNYSFPLEGINVITNNIEINSSSFDNYIQHLQPNIFLFDRFLTEEQFGWRVSENCPDALKILDTEDLHFLRKSREIAFKNKENNYKNFIINDVTKRELASIYRCDLSLIISKFEYKLLTEEFLIPKHILLYIPFLIDLEICKKPLSFNERANFLTVGNFNHKPNWQSVLLLKEIIWPIIRKKLPNAKIYVIGAYNDKAKQLHNKKDGFIIKGWVNNIEDYLTTTKVMLAPIPFGAGLKGKLFESMIYGIPNVTTNFGAEGLNEEKSWNGFIEDDFNEFALKAVELYTTKVCWDNAQENGFNIVENNFNKNSFLDHFFETINEISSCLEDHRNTNFVGEILKHHTLQSTKYLSKWIELKNK